MKLDGHVRFELEWLLANGCFLVKLYERGLKFQFPATLRYRNFISRIIVRDQNVEVNEAIEWLVILDGDFEVMFILFKCWVDNVGILELVKNIIDTSCLVS